MPSPKSWQSVSCPAANTSRLSGKCRKKVLLVSPRPFGDLGDGGVVVALLGEQVQTRRATSRSRASGSHRAIGPMHRE